MKRHQDKCRYCGGWSTDMVLHEQNCVLSPNEPILRVETTMELYDVVTKLVGPVSPIGSSAEDERRLDNLKELCKLVDLLVNDISMVSIERDVHMASVKAARGCAVDFIEHIKREY